MVTHSIILFHIESSAQWCKGDQELIQDLQSLQQTYLLGYY